MSVLLRVDYNPNNESVVTLYPAPHPRVTLQEQARAFLGAASPEMQSLYSTVPGNRQNFSSLDISSEFRTICQAHEYKRTKFGRYAQTRIMRAGGAMDKHDPNPSNYLFFTATLPGDDDWAKWLIASESHHIVDGLKSWLSKMQGNRLEFYVWEHQKRAALHLHYCVHVPDSAIRERMKSKFARQWIRLLDGCEQRTGVSVWGKHSMKSIDEKLAILQTTVQEVHTSVAAYMSGYCGGAEKKHGSDSQKYWYPKRWYGISRPLSALIKQHTFSETKEYPNYRTAKLAMLDIEQKLWADSLTRKNYPHKVGKGETTIFYHLPQDWINLCQEKPPMIFSQQNYPNTSFFIKQVESLTSICSRLRKDSKQYRELFSKPSADCLEDALYWDSLRRGTLRDIQIQAVEVMFTRLSSESSLSPSLLPLVKQLRLLGLLISMNHSSLKYDRHGWLNLTNDLPYSLASLPEWCYARTSFDGEAAPSGGDSSSTHVVSEPTPDSQQLSFI